MTRGWTGPDTECRARLLFVVATPTHYLVDAMVTRDPGGSAHPMSIELVRPANPTFCTAADSCLDRWAADGGVVRLVAQDDGGHAVVTLRAAGTMLRLDLVESVGRT